MKLNRNGYANGPLMLLFITVPLLLVSIIFGLWAFSGRQNYKNNVNKIVISNVKKAQIAQQVIDTNKFNSSQSSSLTTYNGPSDYGSIVVAYPKTWSAYVNTINSSSSNGSLPVDGFFMPNYLSSVADDGNTNFALRVQVESQSYSAILQQFDQAQNVTVSPYALPKVPNDVGVQVSGQITNNINGTMIILPLRSQALEVWTEGNTFKDTFNNIILANLSFSP